MISITWDEYSNFRRPTFTISETNKKFVETISGLHNYIIRKNNCVINIKNKETLNRLLSNLDTHLYAIQRNAQFKETIINTLIKYLIQNGDTIIIKQSFNGITFGCFNIELCDIGWLLDELYVFNFYVSKDCYKYVISNNFAKFRTKNKNFNYAVNYTALH